MSRPKRLLSIVAAFSLILSLLPTAAFANVASTVITIAGEDTFTEGSDGTLDVNVALGDTTGVSTTTPLTLKGLVTSDGSPVPGLDIAYAGPAETTTVTTDGEGVFTVPPTAPWTLATQPALASGGIDLELSFTAAVGDTDVALQLVADGVGGADRIAGQDRIDTAAQISAGYFAPGVDTVYVATSQRFPDALSGSAAAAEIDAPLLLVNPQQVPAATATELERLAPRQIKVLGGPDAVSDATASQLAGYASDPTEPVVRLGGVSRYETSQLIAEDAFDASTDTVYIATGENFPDALSGGPAAAADGAPVLLTATDVVPGPIASALTNLSPSQIVVLGGETTVSASVAAELANYASVDRIAGSDRYETSALISSSAFTAPVDRVFIATGENFPDALAGGPAAAAVGAPLLLINQNAVPSVIADEIDRLGATGATILGGETTISANAQGQVDALLGEGTAASDLTTTTITVTDSGTGGGGGPTNTAPTVDAITDQTADEGESVELQVTAADADGDTLAYAATGLPAGLSIDSTTGLISGTVDADAASGSPYAVTVSVDDGVNDPVEVAFSWTIVEVVENAAPTVDAVDNQSGTEGDVVELQVTAADADGDTLAYAATGLPAGLSIDSATGLISGTIADGAADASPFAVTVSVDDGVNPAVDELFAWTVDAAAVACTPISTLECGAVLLDTPVTFDFEGAEGGLVDGDGDAIGFTMVDPPSARLAEDDPVSNPDVPGYEPDLLNVDPAAGTFTIDSTNGIQYANNSDSSDTNSLLNAVGVAVQVDGTLELTTTLVTPDFANSNNSQQGGLWFGLDEDNLYKLVLVDQTGGFKGQLQREVAGQVDGSVDELNTGVLSEGDDVTLRMVVDPTAMTVTGFLQVGDAAEIQIEDGTLPLDQEFVDGALLPDGETGPATFAGLFASSRRAADANMFDAVFADFAATVEAPDTEAPAAPANLAATAGPGIVNLDWDDNTDDAVGYRVYRSTTSPVDTSGAAYSGDPLVPASDYDDLVVEAGTEYFYAVTAVDAAGNESVASVEVSATPDPENTDPVVDPIADQDNVEGDEVTLQVTATDAENDPLDFAAEGLPAGLSIEATTGLISGTIEAGAADASPYAVTVTVTDDMTTPQTVDFTWTVTAPVSGEPCEPRSTLPCTEIEVATPYDLDFTADEGGLVDADGEGTGFTMVDPPSARLASDDPVFDATVPGYEPSLLDVDTTAGTLTIEATKGIAFSNPSASSDTNSQINALGVGVDTATGAFDITASLQDVTFPSTQNFEQAGMWFGLDEANFVKFAVLNQGGGIAAVQLKDETGDVTTDAATDQVDGANLQIGDGLDIDLVLTIDPSTQTASATYAVNGGVPMDLGTVDIDASYFAGVAPDNDTAEPLSYAGVFASTRRAAASSVQTFTFADFGVTAPEADTEAPAAPVGLTATPGDGAVTLDWTDNVDDAVAYNVYRSETTPVDVTTADLVSDGQTVSISLFTDDTAVNGTTYHYAVSAVDLAGNESELSGEASATPEQAVAFVANVNFNAPDGTQPDGYALDYGQAYGDRGNGLVYGWVEAADGTTPLDLTGGTSGNGRDRGTSQPDQRLDTLVHMQGDDIEADGDVFSGVAVEGIWEIAVPDGTYEVTVAAGDPNDNNYANDPEVHSLNVEGQVAILPFAPPGIAGDDAQHQQATVSVGVRDGNLTIDAEGGTNTKINFVDVTQILPTAPYAYNVTPDNYATDVALLDGVATDIAVPGAGVGVDPNTIPGNVKLFDVATNTEVPSTAGSTGGNDAITLAPNEALAPDTQYRFEITDAVQSEDGDPFLPVTTVFTTGTEQGGGGGGTEEFTAVTNAEFDVIDTGISGIYFTTLQMGPDGKLYGASNDGRIFRYDVAPDGTLSNQEILKGVAGEASTGFPSDPRLLIGLEFDENATADNLIAWVTHTVYGFSGVNDEFGGEVTRLSGPDLGTVQDVFVNLPRSAKDHVTNSITHGPDGDLYFLQGSNLAAGDTDSSWGNRPETPLTAAVLHFDPDQVMSMDLPIDVRSEAIDIAAGPDWANNYNPYAPDAPLKIFATGVRNAYDLVWHENGSLYVPTNGTAAGGESPSYSGGAPEWCDEVRIDGLTAADLPDSAPGINSEDGTGTHNKQRDFLFEVEQGGYYGHPNPSRCEWILNNGNPTASTNDPGEAQGGSKYPVGTQPDPNYRGWAWDFEFNKSPNGVIEYQNAQAGAGELEGRLMVVRFSGNNDIFTLQVASDGDVLGAQPGAEIPGFGQAPGEPYNDPLDLVENPVTGDIYMAQYDRGGSNQNLWLVRPTDRVSPTGANLQADVDELVFSSTQSTTDGPLSVEITNTGADPATLATELTGPDAADFAVSGGAGATLATGESTTVDVTFDPAGTTGNLEATLTVSGGSSSASVDLFGLSAQGEFGGNEPTLAQVFDTLGYSVDPGWTTLADGTGATPKGDEIAVDLFTKAGSGDVTMTPVASFAPMETIPFGWTSPDGTENEIGSMNDGQQQTLLPEFSGATTFDPGSDEFGLYYYSNGFGYFGYTEDSRNTQVAHRARVYPAVDRAGNPMADSYIIAFEDASNGDYQDYVFLATNLQPATGGGGGGGTPTGDIAINFGTVDSELPDGYLRDYGQSFDVRSAADQGDGEYSYGWITTDTGEPVSLVGQGRDRDLQSDQRLDTTIHMEHPTTPPTGFWEIAVADGEYQVAVTVGDPSVGSDPEIHRVNAEGVTIVDNFEPSGAAGADTRHATGSGTVTVTDGALTLDYTGGGVNTKLNSVEITPVSTGGGDPDAQVTFQPATTTTPDGWEADTGLGFDVGRGYGWVSPDGSSTVTKTADTRDRGDAGTIDSTLVIVDSATVNDVVDGAWEYALAAGTYEVTVASGDPEYADSTHTVIVEGQTAIDGFVPASVGDSTTGTVTVDVTDGRLTVESGGTNTKFNWVTITNVGDVGPDETDPTVELVVDGSTDADGAYLDFATVTINAGDAGGSGLDTVTYAVDGGAEQTYTLPFQVNGVGSHTVEATATDGAGNTATDSITFDVAEFVTTDGVVTTTNAEVPFDDFFTMSRIESDVDNPKTAETATVVIGNSGTEDYTIDDLVVEGGFAVTSAPTLPFTVAPNETVDVEVTFVAVGSGSNQQFNGTLTILSDASSGRETVVDLSGIWQTQEEGGNEPNVAEIVTAYGYGTTIVNPGEQINNNGVIETIGDEVLVPYWERADKTAPVTVTQLAAYHTCCNNTATFKWFAQGNPSSTTNVITHDGEWAQTLRPRINGSDVEPATDTFTPGATVFGFQIDPEYSDPLLNNAGPDDCSAGRDTCGHHVRVWPAKDRAGAVIPWTYIITMDYSGINYDFNDNVYLVENIAPEGDAPEPEPVTEVRINAGGPAVTTGGVDWLADQFFTGGKQYTNPSLSDGDIAETTDDVLYLSEHSATTDLGTFDYSIPITDGDYTVRLHFAEIYWGATGGGSGSDGGERVFSANIEGGAVELSDYDINADVGPQTAVVFEYPVTVSDGDVDIAFTASVNQPKVSAIEVVPG